MTPDLTLRQQSEYGLHLPDTAQPVQAFLLVATDLVRRWVGLSKLCRHTLWQNPTLFRLI